MSTKLTGCELLAESVTLLVDHSARKTAALCGYKNKKSWFLAVEKAKKQVQKKKFNNKKAKKPIALLCAANDKVVSLKGGRDAESRGADDFDSRGVMVF